MAPATGGRTRSEVDGRAAPRHHVPVGEALRTGLARLAGSPSVLLLVGLQAGAVLLLLLALAGPPRRRAGVLAALALGALLAPALALRVRPDVADSLGRALVRRGVVPGLVEECCLALCLAVVLLPRRTWTVAAGAAAGGAAGLGFALTEALVQAGRSLSTVEGLAVLQDRVALLGTSLLSHVVCTAWLGAGLAVAARAGQPAVRRLGAALGGLAVAVVSHAGHDALAGWSTTTAVRGLDGLVLAASVAALVLARPALPLPAPAPQKALAPP